MIERLKQSPMGRYTAKFANWAQSWLAPALLRRRTFGAALAASLLAALYWGFIASDRYVSEAHIIVQQTDLSGTTTMDIGSLLSNTDVTRRADQLLLRDHLLSSDMLMKLEDKLQLRAHYSDVRHDPLSRLWSKDEPIELFHEYYLSRVSVEFDDYSGVLIIRAQAYTPEKAKAIATMLVEEGERFMNSLAHGLARDQVKFLEKQVNDLGERLQAAQQRVLDYQNKEGLVSPPNTAENLTAIVNRLESQLAELQVRRAGMLGYLVPSSPDVVELNLQIEAIKKQIAQERARLAAPAGGTLNRKVEEFQRLQLDAEFANNIYKTALIALEKGRVEATRTLRKVSVLRSPSAPQYPLEPRRLYNTVLFILVTLLIAGILHLLAAIVRDHRD